MQTIASNCYINEICKLRILQQEEVRKIEFSDAETNLLFSETKEYLNEHLNKDITFFIKIIDEKIVATCGIQIIKYMPRFKKNGIVGYICDVYTLTEYRKRGIQRNLFNEAVKFAKKNNVEKLELYTGDKNMISLYENLGFSLENYTMYRDI